MKNPLTAGIESSAFWFVSQHLNHCATAVSAKSGEWTFISYAEFLCIWLLLVHFILRYGSSPEFLIVFGGVLGGTWWRGRLRHCRYKPEGRGFDSRIGTFLWRVPSGRAMALGSTQPLTERVPGGFPEGKDDRYRSDCFDILEPQPHGNLRACIGIALI
jgi:hypothetical protein